MCKIYSDLSRNSVPCPVSKSRLKRYREELHYPDNDQLCEEAVWLSQTLLLGSKSDIDDIADAIQKIYENRDKLA